MPGTGMSGGGRGAAKSRRHHELHGTLRTDRHAELQNPEPPPGRPDPPDDLSPAAVAEWERMIVRLELCGSLFVVDDAAIGQYCKLYAETEECAELRSEARAGLRILEENLGDVDKADKVHLFTQIVKLHEDVLKYVDKTRQGRALLRQYLVEFGLTPASRSRVKLPPKPAVVDAFTAFQQRRQSTA